MNEQLEETSKRKEWETKKKEKKERKIYAYASVACRRQAIARYKCHVYSLLTHLFPGLLAI